MTRVALVGYGLAGRWFHRPLIHAAGLSLSHVVTRDPARARDAADEGRGARVVATVDEIWADAPSYDVVVIATANDAHAPLARRAIDLGKTVVVDKPLAVTADDAAALVDLAADRGVGLTVFHNRRWDSDTLSVRRLLGEGALGRVTRFESRFQRFRPDVQQRWREAAPAAGGGVLLDLGTHLVDQALHLFGPALTVYAEVDVRRRGAVADDDVFVALEHDGGVRSHLWCSLAAPTGGPRISVDGTAAGYVKESLDRQEQALRAGWDPATALPDPEPAGRLFDADGDRSVDSEPGRWVEFYLGLRSAVESGGPLPVAAEDGVRVLRVLEAARRSSATGMVVSLPVR